MDYHKAIANFSDTEKKFKKEQDNSSHTKALDPQNTKYQLPCSQPQLEPAISLNHIRSKNIIEINLLLSIFDQILLPSGHWLNKKADAIERVLLSP